VKDVEEGMEELGVGDESEAGGLLRVLVMFRKLKVEFDGEFKNIFA
jgi:hypothetical protein